MKTIFSFIIFLTSFSLHSQVTQQWVATYNGFGSGNDVSVSVAVDNSGNVYVTGLSPGNGTNIDYATVKYNSSGVQQWAVRYNHSANQADEPSGIAVDNSGNVYVTGQSRSGTSSSTYDYATVKYNSSGAEQWVRRYNGPGNSFDQAFAITTDLSGNVYVTGSSIRVGSFSDFLTIKYNSSGDSVWVRRSVGLVASTADIPRSIFVDNSGNVYVTGQRVASGPTSLDMGTIKYNSAGVQQWQMFYSSAGSYNDYAYALAVDNSGNVFITGYVERPGLFRDYATVKYNSSGVQQWAQEYNGPGNDWDEAYSIAVDGSGNTFITGYSYVTSTEINCTTIKYSSVGSQLWLRNYNGFPGTNGAEGIAVKTDPAGNLYLAGSTYYSGGDIFAIKYNSSGDSLWGFRYNGPGNLRDESRNMTIDNQGNAYVTGRTNTSSTGYDFITIKYGTMTGINPISSEIPSAFSLFQNYPNPFNPMTKIKFDIPSSLITKITVYDILGKEVKTIINDKLNPGTYEVDFDGANLPSGTYFYRLETESFTETKKMILIK